MQLAIIKIICGVFLCTIGVVVSIKFIKAALRSPAIFDTWSKAAADFGEENGCAGALFIWIAPLLPLILGVFLITNGRNSLNKPIPTPIILEAHPNMVITIPEGNLKIGQVRLTQHIDAQPNDLIIASDEKFVLVEVAFNNDKTEVADYFFASAQSTFSLTLANKEAIHPINRLHQSYIRPNPPINPGETLTEWLIFVIKENDTIESIIYNIDNYHLTVKIDQVEK